MSTTTPHTEASPSPRRVVLGYDGMGQTLAAAISSTLESHAYTVEIVHGSGQADYPDVAVDACRLVTAGDVHSAILVCGTGLGMSITANKVQGIRAARCSDTYSVEKARRNSAANVLALGAELTTPSIASLLVSAWISHDFDSERSRPKLAKIARLEATGVLDG